jgi:hypothetical protein
MLGQMIMRWEGSGGMGSSWHVIEGIPRMNVSYPARATGYAEKLSGPWGVRRARLHLWALEGNIHDTTPLIQVRTVLTTPMIGHTVPPYILTLHRILGTLASCGPEQIAEEVVGDPTRLNGEIGCKDIGQTAQTEGDDMTDPIVDPNGSHLPSSLQIPETLA